MKQPEDPDNQRIITKKWLYWTLAAVIAIIVLGAIGLALNQVEKKDLARRDPFLNFHQKIMTGVPTLTFS